MGPEYLIRPLVFIFKMRIKEVMRHKVFKFAMAGGTGALVQLTSLQLWWLIFPFQLANFFSIETAIFSNFIINNFWTFADTRIELSDAPKKFLQFNLASIGSIIIQLIIAFVGEKLIGLYDLFTLPIINFTVKTGTIFAVIGILIGMVWNFFAYTKFIWKSK